MINGMKLRRATVKKWHVAHKVWNELIHALHGDSPAAAGVLAGCTDDFDEDLGGLCEITEGDRMKLESWWAARHG